MEPTDRIVFVIGKRPASIPEDWRIFNAPRPLSGNKTWIGDWCCGTFYAAVDPADKYAETWIKENWEMDARELSYVTWEQVNASIDRYIDEVAADYKLNPAEVNANYRRVDLLESYAQQKGLRFAIMEENV